MQDCDWFFISTIHPPATAGGTDPGPSLEHNSEEGATPVASASPPDVNRLKIRCATAVDACRLGFAARCEPCQKSGAQRPWTPVASASPPDVNRLKIRCATWTLVASASPPDVNRLKIRYATTVDSCRLGFAARCEACQKSGTQRPWTPIASASPPDVNRLKSQVRNDRGLLSPRLRRPM